MQFQNTIEFVQQVWRVGMGLVVLESLKSLIKILSTGYWNVGMLWMIGIFVLLMLTFWRFFYGNLPIRPINFQFPEFQAARREQYSAPVVAGYPPATLTKV
jgi:hypothetical protein